MLKNGHLSEEEIAIYADAMLANKVEEMDAESRNHILECDECADKVLAVTEIAEESIPEEDTNSVKTFSLKNSYWLQIAASIVVIVGAGLIFLQVKQADKIKIQTLAEIKDSTNTTIDSINIPKKEDQHIAQETKDSVIKVILPEEPQEVNQDQNLLAYAENTDLEKLVSRFIDANLRGDFSIDIESLIKIKQDEELVFEWNNENGELLTIEFFDNTGEKLFEEETSNNIYKTQELKTPGLYYWKLLSEDFDLLFCGKIIVQ